MNEQQNKPKKPILQKRKYRRATFSPGIIILTVLFAVVFSVCIIYSSVTKENSPTESPEAQPSVTVGESDSSRIENFITVTLTDADICKGDLILVNSDYKYVFGEDTNISVYENKTKSYKVSNTEVTLSPTALNAFNRLCDWFCGYTECGDVMIVSGYRDEEFQRKLYDERVERDGEDVASKYVALPGHSEHHTGLAVDLSVYTASGDGYYVYEYDACKPLTENFEKYGFVLRYPEEKANITGINFESWHYRYVGTPHAMIMKTLDLCLEEYIEKLNSLTDGNGIVFDGTCVSDCKTDEFAVCDGSYVIYYVPANKGKTTEITIPSDTEYTISGDNIGGFIVTLCGVTAK